MIGKLVQYPVLLAVIGQIRHAARPHHLLMDSLKDKDVGKNNMLEQISVSVNTLHDTCDK